MPNHHTFTIPNTNHSFHMLRIPKGTVRMGSNDEEAYYYEKTDQPYEVQVPEYFMGQYTVTQALWDAVMNQEAGKRVISQSAAVQEWLKHANREMTEPDFVGIQRPMTNRNWFHAQAFIEVINVLLQEQLKGKGLGKLRLPSEIEWEYAAKGSNSDLQVKFAGGDLIQDHAWYEQNEDKSTRACGLKLPNQFGLYDMSGNVWEWCQDEWFDKYDLAHQSHLAREGRNMGVDRVVRGGSFGGTSRSCRVSCRSSLHPDFDWQGRGFRLALSLSEGG
jgi:formylglycine-generating enzyme required for sulfatase activity